MRRLEFFETRRGQEALLWRRQLRQQRFIVEVEPKTKRGMTQAEKLVFQQKVIEQQIQLHRRAFRSEIVLNLIFHPSSKKHPAPSLHQVAKNFIDLLGVPCSGLCTRRKRILFQDDRNIKLLGVTYWLGLPTDTPKVYITAAPLTDFLDDVALARRILNNDFSDANGDSLSIQGWRSQEFLREVDDLLEDDKDFSDALSEYDRWKAREHEIRSRFGSSAFEVYQRFLLQQAQAAFLQQTIPRLSGWLSLFPRKGYELGGLGESVEIGHFFLALERSTRNLLLSPPIALDLRHLPNEGFRTKEFKVEVKKALEGFRKRVPWLFPLLVPVDVTIFCVPPDGPRGIDLDNLARYILPVVNNVLRPPSTLLNTIKLDSMPNSWIKNQLQAALQNQPRPPMNSVRMYQVIELPRLAGDPPEGYVRLMVSGGEATPNTIWEKIHRLLTAWSESLEWW